MGRAARRLLPGGAVPAARALVACWRSARRRLLAVAGNGLRTAALFWADTNAPQLPSFAHAGIGAVAFAMAAGALFAVARALAAGEGRACAPSA